MKHGKTRAEKVVLAHEGRKAREHIEHKAHEARVMRHALKTLGLVNQS